MDIFISLAAVFVIGLYIGLSIGGILAIRTLGRRVINEILEASELPEEEREKIRHAIRL